MELTRKQIGVLILGCTLLGLMYIFQRVDYAGWVMTLFGWSEPDTVFRFVFNRTVRLIVNDGICMVLVYSLFKDKRYRKMGLIIFTAEILILLPAYLMLKLWLEGPTEISTPLLSFIHRLIVNPTLMILTILAMAYEKWLFKGIRK